MTHEPSRAAGARAALLLVLALASCAAGARSAEPVRGGPTVLRWGTMREVLREGRGEGRVRLADALGRRTVALGVTSGLRAEITAADGRAWISEVVDASSPAGLVVRAPRPDEEAALLVVAEVSGWSEAVLPAVSDLGALEDLVHAAAAEAGLDTARPFPFRVEGALASASVHVLDRSCPLAHPEGRAPWRWSGADGDALLVGFYAPGSAGVLTHHGARSHVHAVLRGGAVAGHLDGARLEPGARLFLPLRDGGGPRARSSGDLDAR